MTTTPSGLRALLRPLSLVAMALGCSTAKRVEYVHTPTADLHKHYELERPGLAPFTLGGVVVSPFFKLHGADETRLLVTLAAHERAEVTLRSAELVGVGASASQRRELPIDQTVTIDDEVAPGVVSAVVIAGAIPNAELAAIGAEGAVLSLSLRVSPEPAFQTMRFDITRQETTQIVSH